MDASTFSHIAPTLPTEPGIYKYFDAKGDLLYVGKAKNIRKRVSSYFSKSLIPYRTREMISRIHQISFTIVNSEHDAFLLENALIKQFHPRFNIDLKDDKTFPYIVIKKEPYPRVFLTRRRISDGSEYLGPFTSVNKVRELMTFIRQFIPLRTCKLDLSEKKIQKGKYKVCLEYHLGNCKGPCVGFQKLEDYEEDLSRMRHFLKGNLNPIVQHYRQQMKVFATEMAFEKAEDMRKRIEYLQQYQAKSTIVNPKLGDLDVCTLSSLDNEKDYVNFLMVRNGTVIDSQTLLLEKKLEETPEETLSFALARCREQFNSTAADVILAFSINYPDPEVTIHVPLGGERKKLIELSQKNVQYFIREQQRQDALHLSQASMDVNDILLQMQEDLHLPALPNHIECFDNSNFQGSHPVSAMVCFRDGKPSKKDYRHFNVKTVEGIDDFATMKEAVERRYKRLLEEHTPLPQLVIIDGGKGQLNAALEAIDGLGLSGRMTFVGLAKNTEELFFPGDKEPLHLPYGNSSLKMIRYIRDQVHRFGLAFHRQKRSRAAFRNELEDIEGIGKSTAALLLSTYRTVKKIWQVSETELAALIGPHKASIIRKAAMSRKG